MFKKAEEEKFFKATKEIDDAIDLKLLELDKNYHNDIKKIENSNKNWKKSKEFEIIKKFEFQIEEKKRII